MVKKRILLKLTGRVLSSTSEQNLNAGLVEHIADQIKILQRTHVFGIVIGGGNILRGDQQGAQLGLSPSVGHQAGMLATVINGLILQNIFSKKNIKTMLLSSVVCPQICETITQETINNALSHEKTIVFAGGTGAPFFTTDTNAIVRGLQIEATQVWKATGVNGIYSDDPKKNKDAKFIEKITYTDAISQKIGIMDTTSLTLAEKHGITIKVFNIFEKDALINTDKKQNFGSLIC